MTSLNVRLITAGLIVLALWLPCPAGAQDAGRSFDISMDPRTIALGEGGTALSGLTDAFAVNPATLASRGGVWFEYSRRGMEWLQSWGIENMGYRSWQAGIGTSAGTFAFSYRRFDMGEFTVMTLANPQGYATVKVFDHTFGLAWARPLTPRIQAGAAAKLYTVASTGNPGQGNLEFTPAYLLDLGITVNSGNVLGSGRTTGSFSLGIALQNLGSNLRMVESATGLSGGEKYEFSEQLPRNLRLGMAFETRVAGREPGNWAPLKATVTGDYWTVLNSRASFNEHYLAYGFELTAYELLSVRLGGHIEPFQSVYGREDVAAMRYGVGIELPFVRFAPEAVPLTLSASYTAIPLYSIGIFSDAPGTANVFSLTLKYQ